MPVQSYLTVSQASPFRPAPFTRLALLAAPTLTASLANPYPMKLCPSQASPSPSDPFRSQTYLKPHEPKPPTSPTRLPFASRKPCLTCLPHTYHKPSYAVPCLPYPITSLTGRAFTVHKPNVAYPILALHTPLRSSLFLTYRKPILRPSTPENTAASRLRKGNLSSPPTRSCISPCPIRGYHLCRA